MLQEIADHVNLTPSYFSTLFKRETGEGLVDYINRHKIDKSIELLVSGNYTIQQLSEAVGIYSESYFCTIFKQYTNLTPKQYRNRLSK